MLDRAVALLQLSVWHRRCAAAAHESWHVGCSSAYRSRAATATATGCVPCAGECDRKSGRDPGCLPCWEDVVVDGQPRIAPGKVVEAGGTAQRPATARNSAKPPQSGAVQGQGGGTMQFAPMQILFATAPASAPTYPQQRTRAPVRALSTDCQGAHAHAASHCSGLGYIVRVRREWAGRVAVVVADLHVVAGIPHM